MNKSRFWKRACPGGEGHVYPDKSFDFAYRCPKCRTQAGVTLAEAVAFAKGSGDSPLRGRERRQSRPPDSVTRRGAAEEQKWKKKDLRQGLRP